MKRICGVLILALSLVFCGKEETPKLIEKPKGTHKKVETFKNIKFTIHPAVDILFVVDNSSSMSFHQDNLAKNIGLFTNALFKNVLIDYHIGVITSDNDLFNLDRGLLYGTPKFIEKTTPNKEDVLKEHLLRGIMGSGTEVFFETTMEAFSPNNLAGANAGFLRDDAYLAIVMITDSVNDAPTTGEQFYNFLLQLKRNDKEKVLGYAAFIPPEDTSCGADPDWSRDNTEIRDYLMKVINYDTNNLNYFSLCSQFGPNLARIGEDLEKRIDLFLPLPGELPVVETIVLKYGDQVVPNDLRKGWTYDAERRGIRIGREVQIKEQPGAELSVTFTPAHMK